METISRADDATCMMVQEELRLRGISHFFPVFTMGCQYDRLIIEALERIGYLGLFVDPATFRASDLERFRGIGATGIIISGGPSSVATEPPPFDETIFQVQIPQLGICLGFQMMAHHLGARVHGRDSGEYGVHTIERVRQDQHSRLLSQFPNRFDVLMSHGDTVGANGRMNVTARSHDGRIAAAEYEHLFGIQFHPETRHTQHGDEIFRRFCGEICGVQSNVRDMQLRADAMLEEVEREIAGKHVLALVSGGSDSAVVATALQRTRTSARSVRFLYLTGVDRVQDLAHVQEHFGSKSDIPLIVHDATKEILATLAGITDMRSKRLAFRGIYSRLASTIVQEVGADMVAQGTLYTDLVESNAGAQSGARRATIREHHNVGNAFGCPELLPLREMFKDIARQVGRLIGTSEIFLTRHPFPGPGLIVRIEGEITQEKLAIERTVDELWRLELEQRGWNEKIWQYGAVITNSLHTGTRGSDRSSGPVVALWAVNSVDGFTATPALIPIADLVAIDRRICNEVRGVGATVYRLTGKPPATIEWG